MSEENSTTIDDIIVSIKLRLAELDLDIHDAKERVISASKTSPSCYAAGYELGTLEALRTEKETLEKIMRGEYGK